MNILRHIDQLPIAPKWRAALIGLCLLVPCCVLELVYTITVNTPLYRDQIEPEIKATLSRTGAIFGTNAFWLSILFCLGLFIFNWIRFRQNYQLGSAFINFLVSFALIGSLGAAIQFQQWWLFCLSESFLLLTFIIVWRRTIPYYKSALQQYNNKNFEQALDFINQSAQARPNAWQVYHLRAQIQYGLGDLSAAQSDAEYAQRLKPNEFYIQSLLGQILLAQSLYQKSQVVLAEACRLNPRDMFVRLMLGRVYYRLDDYENARQILQAVVKEKMPASMSPVRAYYYLGRIFETQEKPEQARAAFENMVAYQAGLQIFKDFIASHATFPEAAADRADLEDIERRLPALP